MELSSENIEVLAMAMSDSTSPIGEKSDVAYQNKSNLSSLYDDQITNSRQCLLNTSIEPMSSSTASCSFNDILDDICEMEKTMDLNQVAENTANAQLPFSAIADPMGSGFFHMPDIEIQQEDYSPDCNFANQADFLQPLGQWPEYLSSLPPALDNLQEVPQLTDVPTPLPTTPTPPCPISSLTPSPQSSVPQETLQDASTVNVNLDLNNPTVPLQFVHNFHFNMSPSLPPQCGPPNLSPQFLTPTENPITIKDQSTVPPKKRPRTQKQIPCFGWARVVPRKAFIQPTEVMILRPLRTRKSASRQNFDLSSYFDTSSISIPMIRERPRCSNVNRRKQKLRTIPGAENLIFEVKEDVDESIKLFDGNNNTDQLYPETEIPELDEIFKRKRRGLSARRNLQVQDQIKTSPNHQADDGNMITPEPPLQEEERVDILESNSDVDSDDVPLTAVKSLKCQNCRKLFKTFRSLTIHSKRCANNRHAVKDEPPDYGQTGSKPEISVESSIKEHINKKSEHEKVSIEQIRIPRPLTRSQTNAAKRKAGGSRTEVAAKKIC